MGGKQFTEGQISGTGGKTEGRKSSGRPCVTCRDTPEDEVFERLAAGASLRKVSREFGVSASSLFRHYRHHHHELRHGQPVLHLTQPYPALSAPPNHPSPPATRPAEGGAPAAHQRAFIESLIRADRRQG